MPPELVVLLLGAAPLAEVRGAIPWGVFAGGLSPLAAFFWAVVGNISIYLVLLLVLSRIGDALEHRKGPLQRFSLWWFSRMRRHYRHRFHKWEAWALLFFVAVPLPFTGAWSAAIAAYVFGIAPRKAMVPGSLGILLSGALVAISTAGIQVLLF